MRSIFLLLIIGLLLYFPSLFGPFIWDDEDFVYANTYVRDFRIDKFVTESQTAGRAKQSNYFRPVPQIVYATTHLIFGFNPFFFHLVNVLVHIAAAVSVFYFFKLFLKSPSSLAPPFNIPFLIALVFLIHPVQTEAVSYISGLSDPLFVMFGMFSLCAFLLQDKRANMLPLSIGLFALSLLSKETGLVFLPLTFLLNYKKAWWHLIVAVIYLFYHFVALNPLDIRAAWGDSIYANSLLVRILTFIQNLFIYIGLLIFPKDLFMERDYSISIQQNITNVYLFIFTAINVAAGYFFWKRNELKSLTNISPLLFCYLAFFVCFIPYTGIVLINGIFYEHFLYLPLVFFFGFFLILAEKLLKSKLVYLPLITILLILSGRNIARQMEWNDSVKFYKQTLYYAPDSARILNGLGMAYAERGQASEAIKTYEEGISKHPTVPNFYHNLGNLNLGQGNNEKAEEYFLKAIEVDPNFIFSWQSLANLYRQTQQKEKLEKLTSQLGSIPW